MLRRDLIHLRIGSRYLTRLVIAVSIISMVLAGIFVWNFFTAVPRGRTTVIVAGDGATVLSWDSERGKLGVIILPGDVRIEGIYSTGQLPVSSLLKLEAFDREKHGLFAKSIADTLGVPIAGVVRVQGAVDIGSAIDALSPFTLTGWQKNSIALPTRFRLWWAWYTLRPDAIWTMNIQDQGVFRASELPDGSTTRVLDVDRFDAVVGGRLEIDSIRREMRRVLIVNTTDALGLGNRVSRTLGRAGMIVSAVENESNAQNGCSVHAKKTEWETHAMQFIQKEFRCTPIQDGVDSRVDFTIRLGESNAEQYR